MTLFSLLAGGVVLACLCIKIFSPKKVEGYKNRIFYRTLYTVRGFDLIQLVWRLFGKIGAGIITRTIGLGYAANAHGVNDTHLPESWTQVRFTRSAELSS